MLFYQGKYNYAKVMIDTIDEATVSQIYKMLDHPAFKDLKIVIMPDTHSGAGSVIGFTATLGDFIIANLIGVDIGCGVLAVNLGQIEIDFADFDNYVRLNMPSGFAIRNKFSEYAKELVSREFKEKILSIAQKVEMDETRALNSIGTLGGGNHFLEIDEDSDGTKWLLLHTGSRNFGLQICKYHQGKAKKLMNQMFVGDAYRDLEFLPMDLGGNEYLEDMGIAQLYAIRNRETILRTLVDGYFKQDYNKAEKISSIHNYINFQDKIIRKGAISAHAGEKILIPLNMRDGVAICMGKGNADWNFSAPHGLGRLYSRNKAKSELSMDEYKSEMSGIWTSCISRDTLDEAPMAYKNPDDVLGAITDTAEILKIIKPVYNFKAGKE